MGRLMGDEALILVAEDDALVGLDIVKALEGFQYKTIGPIATGESVIREAKANKPKLVLMDISLQGGMDGIEASKHIHQSLNIPIVFLTGDSDEKTLQRAMVVHPYGYLIKPFDPLELRSTIDLTLHRFAHEQEQLRTTGLTPDQQEDIAEAIALEGPEEEHKLAVLEKLSIFKQIPAASLRTLAEKSSIRQLGAGEVIVAEGEHESGGFIPLTGRVSITRTSATGKDLIVALLAPGDIFGLFYAFDSFFGAFWATTQVPSQILSIPRTTLQQFVQSMPNALTALTEAMAARLVHSYEFAASLAHASVENRIVNMLQYLLPQFGKSTTRPNEGRIFITRRELADLVGTTPETAIRVTKSLERDGLLDLTRPGIIKITNVDGLTSYLSSSE